MSGFTQPICGACFSEKYPGRTPHRLVEPESEVCSVCGKQTMSGIYWRADPKTVRFPS